MDDAALQHRSSVVDDVWAQAVASVMGGERGLVELVAQLYEAAGAPASSGILSAFMSTDGDNGDSHVSKDHLVIVFHRCSVFGTGHVTACARQQ